MDDIEAVKEVAETNIRKDFVSPDVSSIFVDGLRFAITGSSTVKIGLFEDLPNGEGGVGRRINIIITCTHQTVDRLAKRLTRLSASIEADKQKVAQASSKEETDAIG